MKSQSSKTRGLVQLALFAALITIMAFTPFIGYIPLGFTRATIIHIPVILGALILGPKYGAVLGFIFGLTSLINNTFNPTLTSFVFSPFYAGGNLYSLIICFVPRILVGIIPYYVYKTIVKFIKKDCASTYALAVSGIVGSLVNTILVMNFIYIFFADSYAAVNNTTSSLLYSFILSIIGINGLPEAIVAGIIVTAVGKVLFKIRAGKIAVAA